MKIIYMGTPEIAVAPLAALWEGFGISAVFCQPDKPVGRKQVMTACAVKQFALSKDIPVYQPVTLRDGVAAKIIEDIKPDLIVVMAYGKILPKEILDAPKYGCVNIHASLLPKYRGAAPIQRAIENGETLTGVTFMYMDVGLDTGDIIESYPLEIEEADDAVSVFDKVSALSGEMVCAVVGKIVSGGQKRTPQDADSATLAPIIKKSDGAFGFEDGAVNIVNKVRAFCEWPCACFLCRGARVKVTSAAFCEGEGKAGEVLRVKPLTVAAGGGSVVLNEVVPEGSRRMTGAEWAAGLRLRVGDVLEEK